MAPLRVGVVGAGSMGQHHIRIYSRNPGVELVGVVEIDPEKAHQCEDAYGVPVYQNYKELSRKVDAVSIVVPTSEHFRIASYFLQRNVHVLVEKPICLNLEEARGLVDLAKKRSLILQVGHLERFNPAVIELRKHVTRPLDIEAHRLSYRTDRNLDVGIIWDLMIHDLDILINLVQSPVVDISSVGLSVYSSHEDLATVHLEFKNGCVAKLVASRVSGERSRTLRVMEADRSFSLDFINQTVQLYQAPRSGQIAGPENLVIQKAEPLKLELDHFLECIRTSQPPEVSGEDGKRAIDLALRAVNSMKLIKHAEDPSRNKIAMAG